jgi:hypothetical protein
MANKKSREIIDILDSPDVAVWTTANPKKSYHPIRYSL